MKYRSWPITGDDTPPEELRLTLIQDRLIRHEMGIPPHRAPMDFETWAVEDIRWLLEYVDRLDAETRDLRTKRERERQELLDSARSRLKDAKETLCDVVCEADLVLERFVACQKKIDELESKPEVQLAAAQADLKAVQCEVSRLKIENGRLRDQLSSLPPTWLERLNRHI